MADTFDMIAKTFFGLEGVLADELAALGAEQLRRGRRMVAFNGDRELMYRANIALRTAVRVLKPIATFTAADDAALYRGVGLIDWQEHLNATSTLAVDPVVHGGVFTNSLYAAQRAKDSIVDQLRERTGQRPSVNLADPDLRINLHIDRQRVTVYLDASGDSLHKRGYRAAAGEAPINEVLAAGILRLTGWDAKSALADFMCGSGTFLIEAALMARRIAPGLVRQRYGYMRWQDFDRALHERLLGEARAEVLQSVPFRLFGSDLDAGVIDLARENARRAGVARDIDWQVASFEQVSPPAPRGTLVVNPPYDERMQVRQIETVYRRLGDALKRRWPGYTAWVFTGNLEAGRQIGLRPTARLPLFNGPIECRLLEFPLVAATSAPRETIQRPDEVRREFANRLARMAKHWHRWARRQGITCYRLYDRDVPAVPLAIDWYEGHVVMRQYRRAHGRTQIEDRVWLDELTRTVAEVLQVPPGNVTLRGWALEVTSARREQRPLVRVCESEMTFEVDLSGQGPTGLDLDRRMLRSRVRGEATGKRFLELFARSGTFTVAASVGGASATTSVSGGRASVAWVERNLRANDLLDAPHELICQDPVEFVRSLAESGDEAWDLAVVEPPNFDGRRSPGVWNVQDGHVELLNGLLKSITPGGRIYFLTKFRRLKLHADELAGATVRELTRQTVPPDFRNKRVHRVWSITKGA